MTSIPHTSVKQQEVSQTPSNLSEQDSYRMVVRFGKDLLSDGFTAMTLSRMMLDKGGQSP